MRYIKVLSMFVILAVALLLMSTIRTYAGVTPTMIFDCDGDLFIVKSDLAGGDFGGCDTDEACGPGDACADCIEACLDAGFDNEAITATGAGKSRYVLACPGC